MHERLPLIGLDLDGVVAEFVEPFLVELRKEFDISLTRSDVISYDLAEMTRLSRTEIDRFVDELSTSGFYASLKPVDGAPSSIRSLAKLYGIYILTTRPQASHRDTVRWLRRYRIPYDSLEFCEFGNKVSKDDQLAVFVDDNLEQAAIAADHVPLVLLFDQPWNRTNDMPTNCRRIAGWSEAVPILEKHYFEAIAKASQARGGAGPSSIPRSTDR